MAIAPAPPAYIILNTKEQLDINITAEVFKQYHQAKCSKNTEVDVYYYNNEQGCYTKFKCEFINPDSILGNWLLQPKSAVLTLGGFELSMKQPLTVNYTPIEADTNITGETSEYVVPIVNLVGHQYKVVSKTEMAMNTPKAKQSKAAITRFNQKIKPCLLFFSKCSHARTLQQSDIEELQKLPDGFLNYQNDVGLSPFMMACKKASSKSLGRLISASGDIDYSLQSNAGRSAIEQACKNKDTKCLELLIKQNALEKTELHRPVITQSALHSATEKHLSLLLEYGQSVNGGVTEQQKGITPLMKCVVNENITLGLKKMNVLFRHKPNGVPLNVNLQNKRNNTALHYALAYGNVEGAQMLIQENANVDIKNIDGQTPFDCHGLQMESTGKIVVYEIPSKALCLATAITKKYWFLAVKMIQADWKLDSTILPDYEMREAVKAIEHDLSNSASNTDVRKTAIYKALKAGDTKAAIELSKYNQEALLIIHSHPKFYNPLFKNPMIKTFIECQNITNTPYANRYKNTSQHSSTEKKEDEIIDESFPDWVIMP